MTMDRQYGVPVLVCDSCGEGMNAPSDVDACPAFFDAFIEGAKAEGWSFFMDRGEWHHRCPGCAE